ncbi:MAG: ABC transporter substrate-binding protein [Myxococcaceae bacterium]|nr:ABC transporter substrate-binding protein [Myxococcaceae bacterium]
MLPLARRLAPCLLVVLLACKREERTQAPVAVTRPSRAWLAGVPVPESSGRTPWRGGTLTLRVPTEPAGLNRLHDVMRDAYMTRYTVGPLYETLLALDRETGALRPLLAERWEVSADGRAQTFHLRQGVTFHDGQPLTAVDVKGTLDVVMDRGNLTSAIRSELSDLEGSEAKDAHTLVVRWRRPSYPGFRTLVAAVPIMPASALREGFNAAPILRHPVGTGPFRFGSWESGASLTLMRNPSYWGDAASLERVVVRFVRDATVAGQMFERGEFDLMTGILPAQWRGMEAPEPRNAWAIRGYQRLSVLENTYSFLGWNLAHPALADRRVRQALAMLYPGDEVARAIDLGLEPRTTCPFYSASPGCDPEVTPFPHSPERAAALLEAAGWRDTDGDGVREREGVRLGFSLIVTPQSARMARLAPLLKEHLRKGGVDMRVEQVEWAVYVQRLRARQFDAFALQWSALDSDHDLYPVFHSSQTEALNYGGYHNAEVDGLLEALRREFDEGKRAMLARRVHRLVYEDQPYLFLSNRLALDAAKVRVHGLTPSLAWYDLRRVWVDPPTVAAPTP